MNTAIINIKVTPKEKKEAQAIAESLGIPLSTIIKGFLKQFVRTKTITFSAEEPNAHLIESLKQSEEEAKAGRVVSFATGKDVLNYLDQEIKNDTKISSH